MPQLDTELLTAALAGYQQRLSEIDEKMAAIRRQLGIRRDGRRSSVAAEATVEEAPPRKRRRMSRAGKARIIAALKKRWAAYHKAQEAGAGQRPAMKKTAAKKKP
jgi:hypothetical protein